MNKQVSISDLPISDLAKGLCLIDELISAVVPCPRVALRVLVGHDRPDGLHDRRRNEILRWNELQALMKDSRSEGHVRGLNCPK